jgi:PKD repeat protein
MLTVELVSGPSRAIDFQLSADGSFSYTPVPDFNGVDTFTYRVFDGSGYSHVAMAQITITNVNDPPIAQGQSFSTNENTPTMINLGASDIDSTNLSFSIIDGLRHGFLTGNTGTMTCTAHAQGATCGTNIGYSPAANYSGPDSFTWMVSDGIATSNSATVSISVIHINRGPTVNAGGPYTGNVGAAIQFAGSGADPDGDPLTFSWDFGDGATATGTDPTHTYAAAGVYTVTLSVVDPFGASSAAQTTATVTAGVILNPIGNKTVNLGETLVFTVSAIGTAVRLFVAPLPLLNHATFNASTGVFTFRPDNLQVGTFQLTFTAASGAQSASETITITVASPPSGGTTSVRGRVYNLIIRRLRTSKLRSNRVVTRRLLGATAFLPSPRFPPERNN